MVDIAHVPRVRLNNGVMMMPQLGLGTGRAAGGPELEHAIEVALMAGYRLIDTASDYLNEESVGRVVQASKLPRDSLFISTKLSNSDHGYDSTLRAFDRSLQKLNMDYIDLYLIHWPLPSQGKYVESWRAMRQLYNDKRVRAIGVCNFQPHHLERIIRSGTAPAVNQFELHPHLQQSVLRGYCTDHGIQTESFSPLKRGMEIFEDPTIAGLAHEHKKTPAQIILRWHIQEGLVVIPKSITPERIRQNIDIFDFTLDDDDMTAIRALDRNGRIAPHPDIM